MNQEKLESDYISGALYNHCLNGDAFVREDELFRICKLCKKNLDRQTFTSDLDEQTKARKLINEAGRIYPARIWRYEQTAAAALAEIVGFCAYPCPVNKIASPDKLILSKDQLEAAQMALSNRLSLVLGGAGSGKTTLVKTIIRQLPSSETIVLCAPTGKAARNLTERTGHPARTVHSALGKIPDEDFLDTVKWEYTRMVIIDEASMMTLEMLAGILNRVRRTCRVVLIGDNNQLPCVGAGSVIDDLIKIGVPHMSLYTNHRLSGDSSGLAKNVMGFPRMRTYKELIWDESFILDSSSIDAFTSNAAARYLKGESVQVISPLKDATEYSVKNLNKLIRDKVNPLTPGKKTISRKSEVFRDGDRVMITENDRERRCVNGDIGILRITGQNGVRFAFEVVMKDGRVSRWDTVSSHEGIGKITLAYAITVHKSQGSEYDTVFCPITMEMQTMLSRNLFYTAISRARTKVILHGTPQALDFAIRKTPSPRNSMLAEKTMLLMKNCA